MYYLIRRVIQQALMRRGFITGSAVEASFVGPIRDLLRFAALAQAGDGHNPGFFPRSERHFRISKKKKKKRSLLANGDRLGSTACGRNLRPTRFIRYGGPADYIHGPHCIYDSG